MKSDTHGILVVIVTYNAMNWIDRCLTSLTNSSVPVDTYIIDNVSSDNTVEYIKTNYPKCTLIESNLNLGFGKANNLGFEYALANKYEYVYLLNQDAWVFNTTFEQLITIQKQKKEFGILSPMQLYDGCKKIDDNFLLCCPRDMLSDLYCNGNLENVYETEFVMAAHWLISRDCLNKLGGFSPSFPHYGEDHNFIHRARYFNYKVGIVPSVKAIHDRQFRAESNNLKIRKMYLESVARISNINLNLYVNLIRQPIFLASGIFKYKSFTCVKNALKLIMRFPLYIRNRNKSKRFAFLNVIK